MPASEPEPQTGTVSLASTALVTLALLIASVVMFTICMRLLTPAIATFEDRWPHEPFKFLDKRQGHLPRAPLMPWWVERVIV
jgi:hypothetical protein